MSEVSDTPAPGAGHAGLEERLASMAAPIIEAAGVELVEVEVRGSRGSRVVRVVADAEDLDIDRIAALSGDLGAALDERDLIDGSYTLEVSSPGLDRTLQSPRDFAHSVGEEVRVLRNQARPDGAPGEVVGVVREVTDDAVVLEVSGEQLRLRPEEIEHGKVVLPW